MTPEDNDAELSIVEAHLKSKELLGVRMARVLRRTYDMLLDGQHTGRYRWDQLYKTEKTHFGTLVEINLQREFCFADGQSMDFSIESIDVDCKFSQDLAAWMIPPEANGHLLLGLWASDQQGLWAAGLVRADEAVLTSSRGNRDRKRQLTKAGKESVKWLFKDMPLPENALLRINPASATRILDSSLSGQQRVNMLFRLAQGRLISRNVVATAAQQDDYMKRVRGNGGARSKLRPEGIVILGQYSSHGDIARTLGLPIPGRGESLSVRLARRQAHHGGQPYITLDSQDWVIAGPADLPELAPLLPKV